MPFTDPSTVQNPTTGVAISANWGDQINTNQNWFATDKPMCRVYRTTLQVIPNSTNTAITFDAEEFDTATMHSTVTNTSRITVPVDGIYMVGANVLWEGSATGARALFLVVDGATTFQSANGPGAAGGQTQQVTTMVSLSASSYVEAFVVQFSGGDLDVTVGGSYSPSFWCTWIGEL